MEKPVKTMQFIRKAINNLITTSEVSSDVVRKVFADEKIFENFVYCFTNRKSYLTDIFDSLNSKNQNLILINGFQGTGKTTLVKVVEASLEENVLCFYHEFSQISNLDDIILSLYRYLKKYNAKDPEYARTNKLIGNQSIDERLINYLKTLKRPLVIILDGFENIFKIKSDSVDNELHNFINFLLSIEHIKLIISGRKIPLAFKTDKDTTLTLRLGGLDENDALQILEDSNIDCSQSTLSQLVEISRGYPESMMLFISAVKVAKLDAFDILKEYARSDDCFEEYIVKKIYDNIPDYAKKLSWHFAVIRHYIDLETLKKLNLADDTEKSIVCLSSSHVLTSNSGVYYIKKALKEYIYKKIPYTEKISIHKYWHELYAEQLARKLDERYFSISRKLLHSEQYYHYICLTKLDKNFNINSSNKIKYMSDTHLAPLYTAKDNESDAEKNPSYKNGNPSDNAEVIKSESSYNDIYTESDLTIELTDEEKSLLDGSVEMPDNTPEITDDISEQVQQKPENVDDLRDYYLNNAQIQISDDKADYILTNLKKAYEISNNLQDSFSLANISTSIANVLKETDKLDEAVEYYNKAYRLFSGLNDNINAAQTILNLANIYNECYKHDIALQYYHRIIDNGNLKFPEKTYIEALIGIGEIHDYREELNLALRFYKEAYDKAISIDDEVIKSTVCFKLALAYDDMKDTGNALHFYIKSIEISSDYGKNPNLSSAYANIAAIYEEMNDKNQAKEYYLKSLKIDKTLNNWEDQYKTLSRLGNIYFENGNIKEAFYSFQRELAIAKSLNDPYLKAMSFLDLGDLYFYLKNYPKAVKAFILARKTIGNTISTDSKEKIERRFRQVISEINEEKFNEIIKSIQKKE